MQKEARYIQSHLSPVHTDLRNVGQQCSSINVDQHTLIRCFITTSCVYALRMLRCFNKKNSSNNNSSFSSIEFCFIAQMLPKMVSTGWQMFLELLHFFHLHKKKTHCSTVFSYMTNSSTRREH